MFVVDESSQETRPWMMLPLCRAKPPGFNWIKPISSNMSFITPSTWFIGALYLLHYLYFGRGIPWAWLIVCVCVAESWGFGHRHLRVSSGVGERRRSHGAHLLRRGHAVRAVRPDARHGFLLQATGNDHTHTHTRTQTCTQSLRVGDNYKRAQVPKPTESNNW